VTDRGLAVLNALLSFYPGNDLSVANGLVVFPSNAQLALRAHGIAPATLRRHLAALVDANLLIRRDSPNGKRYARRSGEGQVEQAFGFSIAPLIARAAEINRLAAVVSAELLQLAPAEGTADPLPPRRCQVDRGCIGRGVAGDWMTTHEHFRSLVSRIPRSPVAGDIEPVLEEMQMLRDEILNILENSIKTKIIAPMSLKTSATYRIQIPNPPLILNPLSERKQTENSVVEIGSQRFGKERAVGDSGSGLKSFPLGFVLRACPEIAMYGPGGAISSWRDMMAAGVVVRSMLGVSASAYEEACDVMGPENTATVMACVLERAGHIHSAGGYLRDLTRRAEKGEFAIGPMLMALARRAGVGPDRLGQDGRLRPALAPTLLGKGGALRPGRRAAGAGHRADPRTGAAGSARTGMALRADRRGMASCVGGMDMRTERRVLAVAPISSSARRAACATTSSPQLARYVARSRPWFSTRPTRCSISASAKTSNSFSTPRPAERRTLMFSATVPRSIATLAKRYQRDAVRIARPAKPSSMSTSNIVR
jgi:replication initiation protein RepC